MKKTVMHATSQNAFKMHGGCACRSLKIHKFQLFAHASAELASWNEARQHAQPRQMSLQDLHSGTQ